jgi:GNAT superfamily N-acetyltransferase
MILPDDQNGEHYGVFEAEQLVSVVSLFINEGSAQFRKLATLEEKQRLGYGRALVDYVIRYSKSLGAKEIWCNARVKKRSFYENAGFHVTDETFSKDGYDFVIMKQDL